MVYGVGYHSNRASYNSNGIGYHGNCVSHHSYYAIYNLPVASRMSLKCNIGTCCHNPLSCAVADFAAAAGHYMMLLGIIKQLTIEIRERLLH